MHLKRGTTCLEVSFVSFAKEGKVRPCCCKEFYQNVTGNILIMYTNKTILILCVFLLFFLIRQSSVNYGWKNISVTNFYCFHVIKFTVHPVPLWGDKVSMLTHTYPHKPRRKIEVTICKITRLTAHFMCGLMFDLLIFKFMKVWSYKTPNVLTETRCH